MLILILIISSCYIRHHCEIGLKIWKFELSCKNIQYNNDLTVSTKKSIDRQTDSRPVNMWESTMSQQISNKFAH